MQELYELREITKRQIATKHFASEKYANKRLYIMKKEGLITTKVYGQRTSGQTKTAAYVRLTESGMNLLVERGLLDSKSYRARDLGLSIQQRQYITDANELFVQIPGIPFMDSREIKKKYHLNRGNLTVGGFSNHQGDYMIFILNGDAKETTLRKILMEIKAKKYVSGYLVYYKSSSVKRAFETLCHEQALVTGGVPLYMLPFDTWGIEITRRYILSTNAFLNLQELLSSYGTLTRVKEGSNKHGFLYGMRREDGLLTPYVIEVITGDILILKRCLRNYNVEAYQREGRRVLLFCYEDEVQRYRDELLSVTYVDVIGVPKLVMESSFEGRDAIT
ncbi:replication-relaxation family protein [Paenibacillus taichungensis]|uniref:replication-relaxation family protein n=1 Tax=Paenibacillus taichungensis TaxID=484184 RepID=UPI0038282E3B